MRVIVEQLVEWRLAGETEVLGEILPQRHFVHHKIPYDQTRARTPDRRGGKPATNRLSYGAYFALTRVLFQVLLIQSIFAILWRTLPCHSASHSLSVCTSIRLSCSIKRLVGESIKCPNFPVNPLRSLNAYKLIGERQVKTHYSESKSYKNTLIYI
jgi:hypothetical protein